MFLAYAVLIYQHNSHSKIKKKMILRSIEAGQFSHKAGVRQNPAGIMPKVNKYCATCTCEYEQWEIDLSDGD